MTSARRLVDIRILNAVTPDGGQVGYATEHLYADLLEMVGGDSNGLRVVVPDLIATAKRVSRADDTVRYEVKHGDVTVVLESSGVGQWLVMRYGSVLDDEVVQWWAGLNDDQRSRVKQAAEDAADKHDVGLAGVQVLSDTRCPIGSIATKWEENPEYAWSWPESLRQFVLDQN